MSFNDLQLSSAIAYSYSHLVSSYTSLFRHPAFSSFKYTSSPLYLVYQNMQELFLSLPTILRPKAM